MDLGHARFPQKLDDPPGGGTAHKGIVDEYNTFSLHHRLVGGKLHAHAGIAQFFGWAG